MLNYFRMIIKNNLIEKKIFLNFDFKFNFKFHVNS